MSDIKVGTLIIITSHPYMAELTGQLAVVSKLLLKGAVIVHLHKPILPPLSIFQSYEWIIDDGTYTIVQPQELYKVLFDD